MSPAVHPSEAVCICRTVSAAPAAGFRSRMIQEGNDFFNLLCWPSIISFLDVQPGRRYLDIACGNGLTSRRLAVLGARVIAFDFSENLIEKARARANPNSLIDYRVIDATDEKRLLSLGQQSFDAALSNMALFDMADIEVLFKTLPKLLSLNGVFVFSLMHPAFNNASSMHVVEETDDGGEIKTVYSVKISRYMSQYHAKGIALRNQVKPQTYFARPLQYYLNLGFQNGFVLDGFEERAFPPDAPQTHPLGWGGSFSEIPPVLVLSWSGPISLIFISVWISEAIYFKGLSKSQVSARNLFSFVGWRKFGYSLFLNHLSPPTRALVEKEMKTFFRDPTQWSQVFLVMGLIVIYLYNCSVLPLERSPMKLEYLQNLLFYLNMGLAAFVLSAISVRCVFPAVSLEGEAFWIVRASPISSIPSYG